MRTKTMWAQDEEIAIPKTIAPAALRVVKPICAAVSGSPCTKARMVWNIPPPGTRGIKPGIKKTVAGVRDKTAHSSERAATQKEAAKYAVAADPVSVDKSMYKPQPHAPTKGVHKSPLKSALKISA